MLPTCGAAVLLSGGLATGAASLSKSNEIPSGTVIPVELKERINLNTVRPGDKFEAEVSDSVQIDGTIAFPEGTRVLGRVTEVAADGAYARLALESLQRINGGWVSVQTTTVVAKASRKTNILRAHPDDRLSRRKFSFATIRPIAATW
jgi:hypothetical protein